ncbi:MAG: glycoside hydrolase family 43 protein [Dehalococcoidia bacterium]|nr:glycoside hydrolase family 43 protein [Dehalococcoidia bacterium]
MQGAPPAGRRRLGRRAFLRLCGAAAPALAAPWLLGADPLAPITSARRPHLAPPDAPRHPQGAAPEQDLVQGLVMAQTNPIVAENCPDPAILEADGVYYLVSTTHVLPAFPIRRSTDLVHWEHTGRHIFTRENRPSWARDHFWAPELHRVAGQYVAYFTARSTRTGRLCIGAATAPAPEGPYADIGGPLLSERVAVLDPTFFRDDDGRQYLYWKMDGPSSPAGPICVQELRPDGLGFAGPRREVVRDDIAWEGALVEAPAVVKRGGYYYLFYSGGAYDTPHYAVGVARSSSPVSGFEKRGEPILRGSGRWKGPGHNAIASFKSDDYIVYHAWEGDRFRDVRPALLERITWSADGWPQVNDGLPSGDPPQSG